MPDPCTLNREYIARINRVIDHIDANLSDSLSLEELAKVAHFSPFHFHRIFASLVGETLGRYVQRQRLERAANVLISDSDVSVTQVALESGFASPSTFARAFKGFFGVPANAFRSRNNCEHLRKIGKAPRNFGKAPSGPDCYIDPQTHHPIWRYDIMTDPTKLTPEIHVANRPPRQVVYLRVFGPYGQVDLIPTHVAKLQRWAVARGLWTPESRVLGVPHDNPKITDEAKLRLSICLPVPETYRHPNGGEFGAMKLAGGMFAIARFTVEPQQIAQAWGMVYGVWMPQSGYQPDDRLSYEEVIENPRQHPEGKIVLDICVPVRPL